MENTKSKLIALLLSKGQVKLAEALDISTSELSRKINNEKGFTIQQWARALDFIDVQIVPAKSLVLTPEKYKALLTFAAAALEQDMERAE